MFCQRFIIKWISEWAKWLIKKLTIFSANIFHDNNPKRKWWFFSEQSSSRSLIDILFIFSVCWWSLVAFGENILKKFVPNQMFAWELCVEISIAAAYILPCSRLRTCYFAQKIACFYHWSVSSRQESHNFLNNGS